MDYQVITAKIRRPVGTGHDIYIQILTDLPAQQGREFHTAYVLIQGPVRTGLSYKHARARSKRGYLRRAFLEDSYIALVT